MLTLDKIYHAAFVLKDVARKTDLIEAPRLSKDCQLYLKTENLQVTGSFKVRGAYYKISQLSKEESDKGVIACSAGNHAQGVALAATRRGIKSIVCMPDGAPIMKVENTKNLGAEVCLVPGTYDDAHDKAVELQEETGMTFIHPYDDEQVIAGQGTIGLEILDQLPDVDAVIVPVGGGGLISGVAFAIKSLKPDVKVYGVQAEGAPSMYRSLHEHKYQTLSAVSTFADGIQVKTPGELTYELCEEYVDDIVTVTEDETAAAILSLMENQKLVAEGAGGFQPLAQYAGQLDAEDVRNAPDEEDDADDKMVYHKPRSFLRHALNRKTFTVQVYHIGETPARTGFACPAQKIWVEPPGGSCGSLKNMLYYFLLMRHRQAVRQGTLTPPS